jgi:diguanylate cyclase (GGDEF)-like protein
MHLFGRRDSILIVGLTVAVSVVFSQQMSRLLDFAREAEQTYNLSLIPGLIILTVVFVLHQQGKHQESKAEAVAAAATAREAQAHSHDLERLVSFGQTLARSLDLDSIRDVLLRHLPEIGGTHDTWVLVRTDDIWNNILVNSTVIPRREIDAVAERAAAHAVAIEPGSREERDGMEIEGHICFAMMAGGSPIGALGFPKRTALTDSQRGILAAASALLAVSIKNSQLFRDTRENSLRDGLTGCFNRTHGIEMTEMELLRARRSRTPISVIMFDLDHFKDINDRHGHLCGDMVLSTVGRRMKEVLRGSDVRCRYGGEEFLVVLPETPLDGARHVAELLRKEIADNPVAWNGGELPISASFGVTTALENELDTPIVIARADSALYRAKSEGRNCVRMAATPSPSHDQPGSPALH